MRMAGSTFARVRAAAVLLGFSLAACGGDGGGEPSSPTEPPAEPSEEVATVEVTPASATADAIDAAVDFEATARDASGSVVSGTSFAWSSSDPEVATVASDGTAAAQANGEATITAEAQGVTGDATLTVDQAVHRVTVTPSSVTLREGETQRFDAETEDRNGHPVAEASLGWASSDTAVAVVDSTGLATARRPGEVRISAEAEGVADSAALSVETPPSDPLQQSFAGPSGDDQPPDLSIAAGTGGLIVATNGGVTLYSRSGETLAEAPLPRFFGQFPDAGPADPRVVYDPVSERFFITAMDHGRGGPFSTGSPGRFFLAVSTGPDPTSIGSADWHRYTFETPSDPDGPELFPDFSRLGVTQSAVVLVGQMIPIDSDRRQSFECFTRLLIVEKDPVLSGQTPDTTAMDQLQGGRKTCASLKPVKVSTESPNLLLITEGPGCELSVWGLRDPLSDPTIATATAGGSAEVGTAFCDDLPHAEQPGTDWRLDTGRRSPPMAEPVLRAGDLWTARVIGVQAEAGDRTGVQWLRIGVSGWPGSAQVVASEILHQEGYAYYPAISANEGGDFALVYGRSSDTEHPSTYVRSLDRGSETSSSSPRLLRAGDASLTSGNSKPGRIRYGDYFGAAWDPADGSLWVIGQYVKTADVWGSEIGHLAF